MATAPDITFRSVSSPYSVLTAIAFVQSTLGTDNLPVLQSYNSVPVKIRIANNWALGTGIATAMNVRLTTYDGIGAGSHTASQLPASQMWIRVYQSGFGEEAILPGLLTALPGSDTAIGGAGNLYYTQAGSDGSGASQIRAGSGGAGVGFVEITAYAQIPATAPAGDYTFALTMTYEWTP